MSRKSNMVSVIAGLGAALATATLVVLGMDRALGLVGLNVGTPDSVIMGTLAFGFLLSVTAFGVTKRAVEKRFPK